ncbi:MAG TPA: 3-phosphoshikimate 1-carboxyvinyltransferase [Deltaproteobacteria bacterium]|nr:3-phosphoshikimate 1-carboxyvinyltransferase [Deltaproteobacteria bacterium]
MKAHGEITPPPDKSITHRCFMIGSLAHGTTVIRNALESEDIASTRKALAALGASIRKDGDSYLVDGSTLREPTHVVDAGNSGTTARLVSGIVSGIEGITVMTGDESLIKRPMARVIKPLELMGARFMARSGSFLPMAVRGGKLRGIFHPMEVASAQVKSALLLAGLFAEGTTTVNEPSTSRDHTERMLAGFGATVEVRSKSVSVTGPQQLTAREITVPGDPSSAAFPVVWAAATPGSSVLIRGVCLNPTRTGFLRVLERMGACIAIENEKLQAGEPVGDLVVKGSHLKAVTITAEEVPSLIDEIPALVVAAALAEGTTVITGARELRVKETDRISAMVEGLTRLGATVEELEDGLIVNGPARLSPASVRTFSDHRIAMSFAVLARASDTEIGIDDPSCVRISYPRFFEDMDSLA